MRTLLRRRVIVPAAVAFVVVAVATGTAWYLLSGERRMGLAIERLLTARTGLPIAVQRASWDGRRLVLRGVRLTPTPELAVDVRVGQLEVDAGIMTLVSPAGRKVSIVATSTSITWILSESTTANGVDALRGRLLDFLNWPGVLSIRSRDVELRTPTGEFSVDVVADKHAPALTATLTAASREAGEPLRLTVRGAPALGRAIDFVVDVSGSPHVVGALWPAVKLPASSVGGRVQLQLIAGGVVSSFGRLSLGSNGQSQQAVDFTARYDSTSGKLAVSRYALRWGDDVSVTGTARLDLGDGAFEVDVKADRLDATAVRRFGLTVPFDARDVSARAMGRAAAERLNARVEATAAHVALPWATNASVGASIHATITGTRSAGGFRLSRVEDGRLELNRAGRSVLTSTVTSASDALWPLAIDAAIDDLSRATPLLSVPGALTGSARLRGSLTSMQPATFRGTLDARLPRARFDLGGPIELSEVRIEAPVTVGARGDPPSGGFGVARAVAYGLALENLTAQARLADDRALFSEILYTQYGGKGTGWVDASNRPPSPPFQGRFEAERIDLARFVKESGATVARVTGTVRYVATVQYLGGQGFVADAHIESTSGGEISIDAIEGLLGAAAVQTESTGILRRTLENLRAFEYASLEGDLRYRGGAGFVDLSLRGKKRLGIFPAPVEALNFRNVPLTLLVRILTKGSAR